MPQITYDNGDVYDGEVVNGRRHGRGHLRQAKGHSYRGEWRFDERHGFGVFRWVDGSVSFGEWRNDKLMGIGVESHPDCCLYEGEWKNGLRDGKGVRVGLKAPYGRYVGQFKSGMKNGDGVEYHEDGQLMFKGTYKLDKRFGFGSYYYDNGSWIKGEFAEDQLVDGYAEFYFAQHGSLYKGQVKDYLANGRGTVYKEAESLIFEGDFVKGMVIKGHTKWTNGDSWEGFLDADRFFVGVLTFAETGDTLTGSWTNIDIRNSKGELKLTKKATGEVVMGEWVNKQFVPSDPGPVVSDESLISEAISAVAIS